MLEKEQLGVLLRELRLKEGLTQEELAEKANIESKHLGRIERGEHYASYRFILEILKALDITVCLLKNGKDVTEEIFDIF